MAKLKTVYFCESDPEKWFHTKEEADNFDLKNEIVRHVHKEMHSPDTDDIVDVIMERYEIKQRWDYKADHEAGDAQE